MNHQTRVAVRLRRADSFFCLLTSVCCLLSTGCSSLSSRPRVLEVSSSKRTQQVEQEDKRQIFLQDRASRLHMDSKPLRPEKQRQEFFVSWAGAGIATVKFEYRQVKRPNTILSQEYLPHSKQELHDAEPYDPYLDNSPTLIDTIQSFGTDSHVFTVSGKDFTDGGSVSAWRVTLWSLTDTNTPLAQKKSSLW